MPMWSCKDTLRRIVKDIPNDKVMTGFEVKDMFSALLDYVDKLEEVRSNELFMISTYKENLYKDGKIKWTEWRDG